MRSFTSKKPTVDLTRYDQSQTRELNDRLILVDNNDTVVGNVSKVDAHLNALNKTNPHHRAFSVFIFNNKNELLIHQRSEKKITFPLYWTNSCCSHPLYTPDEMIEENHLGIKNAINRRVKFELGLDLKTLDDLYFMGKIKYEAPFNDQWGEKEIDSCYIVKRDFNEIDFNKDEIKEIKWVKKKDIINFIQKRIDNKENITPWFEMILKHFFFKWWEIVEKNEISKFVPKHEVHELHAIKTNGDKDSLAQSINIVD